MLSIIIIIILLLTVAGLLAMLLRLKKEISNLKSSLVTEDSVPEVGAMGNREEARNEAAAERELILVASEDRHVLHELTEALDRKSTRLNSSHANISYAVFCLKKKTT